MAAITLISPKAQENNYSDLKKVYLLYNHKKFMHLMIFV